MSMNLLSRVSDYAQAMGWITEFIIFLILLNTNDYNSH
jgi:hypothetical protein